MKAAGRTWVAMLILWSLTGCASAPIAYEKADVSADQQTADSAACEMEGEKNRTFGGMGGLAGIVTYNESFNRVYDACMRSKGYAAKF